MTTSLGARYLPAWPDGTKHFKPAYVHTREELKVLIRQMNAERKAVYFLFGFLLMPKSLMKSSNNEVSAGSNISHFPSW